jgi:hypothetical protein
MLMVVAAVFVTMLVPMVVVMIVLGRHGESVDFPP